jgi:hypothetical protein
MTFVRSQPSDDAHSIEPSPLSGVPNLLRASEGIRFVGRSRGFAPGRPSLLSSSLLRYSPLTFTQALIEGEGFLARAGFSLQGSALLGSPSRLPVLKQGEARPRREVDAGLVALVQGLSWGVQLPAAPSPWGQGNSTSSLEKVKSKKGP